MIFSFSFLSLYLLLNYFLYIIIYECSHSHKLIRKNGMSQEPKPWKIASFRSLPDWSGRGKVSLRFFQEKFSNGPWRLATNCMPDLTKRYGLLRSGMLFLSIVVYFYWGPVWCFVNSIVSGEQELKYKMNFSSVVYFGTFKLGGSRECIQPNFDGEVSRKYQISCTIKWLKNPD